MNKLYSKADRSTFPYWFWHWYWFNRIAFQLGCWKLHFILHDIEKPWLMLFWKDYNRVKKWHRDHSSHHLFNNTGKYDWLGMMIDWECSRYSKAEAQMNAYETYMYEIDKCINNGNSVIAGKIEYNMKPLLQKYNLWKS